MGEDDASLYLKPERKASGTAFQGLIFMTEFEHDTATGDHPAAPPAPTPDEALLAAVNLAKNCGWSGFPVLTNKRPACPLGFKAASRDPNELSLLWARYPGPLVGVPTGERSAFDVLDVDLKHDTARAWLIAVERRIPRTRVYQTRSGGWHVLFRHATGIRNSEGKLARGIDVRGEGGYIVFWHAAGFPCTDSAPIADWPDWLLALLLAPKPEPIPTPAHQRFRSRGGAPQEMIARQLARLETAPDGQRHATLRAAACTIGGVLAAAGLPKPTAEQLLLDAVIRAGGARVDRANAVGTIRWGLDRGAQSPLQGAR